MWPCPLSGFTSLLCLPVSRIHLNGKHSKGILWVSARPPRAGLVSLVKGKALLPREGIEWERAPWAKCRTLSLSARNRVVPAEAVLSLRIQGPQPEAGISTTWARHRLGRGHTHCQSHRSDFTSLYNVQRPETHVQLASESSLVSLCVLRTY